MNLWRRRCFLAFVFCWSAAPKLAAAEVLTVSNTLPSPRPRLTETLRAQAEIKREIKNDETALSMERVIVRDTRLPSGPPKEKQREGPFSLTQGGYVWKNQGKRFSTEIGLWVHVDIIEGPRTQLQQTDRIQMDLLRISW